jgi:hypothetical protein
MLASSARSRLKLEGIGISLTTPNRGARRLLDNLEARFFDHRVGENFF